MSREIDNMINFSVTDWVSLLEVLTVVCNETKVDENSYEPEVGICERLL